MEAGAHGIARLAKAAHDPLVGRITLSAPPVLVTHLLAEHLTRFRVEYPDIRLSLSAQGQQISLSRREADVAVRLVQPNEAGSVTRKVGTMAFGLNAHRSYAHLAAPERWEFIAFDQHFADMPQQSWLLGIAGDRPVACELNHISEHLIAVRTGVGVAGLPCSGTQPTISSVSMKTSHLLRVTSGSSFTATCAKRRRCAQSWISLQPSSPRTEICLSDSSTRICETSRG